MEQCIENNVSKIQSMVHMKNSNNLRNRKHAQNRSHVSLYMYCCVLTDQN